MDKCRSCGQSVDLVAEVICVEQEITNKLKLKAGRKQNRLERSAWLLEEKARIKKENSLRIADLTNVFNRDPSDYNELQLHRALLS